MGEGPIRMSYLALPRIAFAGRFIADVSTRNNDNRNFVEDAIQRDLWNPRGGATFEFVSCHVTGGAPLTSNDPAGRLAVSGAEARPSAKMVDLDPGFQGASEIWGLSVRLFDPQSNEFALEGNFAVASFRDLYTRQVRELREGRRVNLQEAGGRYVSVLENVHWGPIADRSPLLSALREVTETGSLSIAMHHFGYFYAEDQGRHATGSVVGCIGPRTANEPRTVVVARRLQSLIVADLLPGQGGTMRPGAVVGPIDFEVNAAHRTAHFDLGHACLIDDVEGAISDIATLVPGLEDVRGLAIGLLPSDSVTAGTVLPANQVRVLAEPDVLEPNWYRSTGGVVDVDLPADVVGDVDQARLALYASLADGTLLVLSVETAGGLFFRADCFVHRLDPSDKASVTLHARRFGKPAAGELFEIRRLAPAGAGTGLSFLPSVTTDSNGRAIVALTAADPGNPRGPIDGEIFILGYAQSFDAAGNPVLQGTGLGGLDLIVAHVRDSFAAAEPIDFNAHVRPIMAQYAQLYPIMSFHLFDLADYDQLVRHRQPLLLAFQRPIEDPNYMPVTRDLSRAKVEAIVAWLKAETGDPTEPLPRGVAPLPHLAAETEATRRRALAEAIGAAREDAKTAAARAFAVKSGVYLNLPFRSE